jgi:acetoin:2,6-dichlorophenolindophenol oxidoreductase subunit beta
VSGIPATYREAVALALADEMEADPDVFCLGEDIGAAGGVFKTTVGLFERFGPDRVRDTPISEQAIVGAALGAALTGLRPVAELMFADFAGVGFDQIANQLAKFRYMSGGQTTVPVTIRMAGGAGLGFAAQHSQTAENWFLNVPGLMVCAPATPADAYGLLRSAIRNDNPVIVLEHKALYANKGEVEPGVMVPLGVAEVVRVGDTVTVAAPQQMRHRTIAAADDLAAEGVEVEMIDPRTLAPIDMETIAESVRKTGRLVCVQESPAAGSWGATVIAHIVEHAFDALDAPPALIAADHTPIPYSGSLEDLWMPTEERIADGIRRVAAL